MQRRECAAKITIHNSTEIAGDDPPVLVKKNLRPTLLEREEDLE